MRRNGCIDGADGEEVGRVGWILVARGCLDQVLDVYNTGPRRDWRDQDENKLDCVLLMGKKVSERDRKGLEALMLEGGWRMENGEWRSGM